MLPQASATNVRLKVKAANQLVLHQADTADEAFLLIFIIAHPAHVEVDRDKHSSALDIAVYPVLNCARHDLIADLPVH